MQDPKTGAINFNARVLSDNGSIENDKDMDGFSQAQPTGQDGFSRFLR